VIQVSSSEFGKKSLVQHTFQAIVLDGNQRSALATVRSLGRRGIAVAVAESRTGSLAAASRFCRSELVYPDPATAPDDFIDWLGKTAVEQPEAVLLPMTDMTVPLVLRAAATRPSLRTALPSEAAYHTVSDKGRLAQIANDVGVRTPATVRVSRSTLTSLDTSAFRYPIVVKPPLSATRIGAITTKRGVRYASNPSELLTCIARMLADDTDELLIQEYVEGHGAGVFALYERGEPRLFFAHRRIREKPPSGGVSVVCESVALPEQGVTIARKLLDSVGWHGVAMVELKIDTQGQAWLIEINARFWGSLQLAVDSGADFPWLIYQIARGESPEIPPNYSVGKRLRWWLGDLDNLYARLRDSQWTPTLFHKARAMGEFLVPWSPGMRYEFLRWNDPAPSLAALRQYVGALGRRRPG
jgi:predicted ATP-grasp superfamily ATP-dependent carboligase